MYRTKSDKTYSAVKGAVFGIIVTLLIILIGISVLALVILNGNLDNSLITFVLFTLLALSAYTGTYASYVLVKRRYLVIGTVHVATLVLLMIGIHLLLFDGNYSDVMRNVFGALIGVISAWITVQIRKKTRRKNRYR